MSKAKFSAQAEKLKNLVDSARLQTSSSAVTATAPSQPNEGAEEVSGRPVAARRLRILRPYRCRILKLMRNLKRPVKHLWILAHILLRL
jgi:hypothetical protein